MRDYVALGAFWPVKNSEVQSEQASLNAPYGAWCFLAQQITRMRAQIEQTS